MRDIASGAEDGASGGWARTSGDRSSRLPFGLVHSNCKPAERVAITRSRRSFGIADLSGSGPFGVRRRFGVRRASVTRSYGIIGGEFDPGSGSTLAACLMHASRARTPSGVLRGGRVRNTWATCPGVGDSRGKPRVIPHTVLLQPGGVRKTLRRRPWRGLRPISLLVG